MDTETIERNTVIAEDNDMFRKSNPAEFTITVGVWKHCNITDVIDKVRQCDSFTKGNDPYGEHDFGSFELDGRKLFWKIDYFGLDLQGYCDPLSNDCRRVLTVMLAEEY